MAPSPFGIHQRIVMRLILLLGDFLEEKNSGELIVSPMDVILEAELNVVQPDLIYIKNQNLSIFHPQGHIQGVPDLLIEVVSPGSVTRDTVEKFKIYESYRVPEYWIVFPEQKVIEVFALQESKYQLFCSTEKTSGKVRSAILEGLSFQIESVFG